MADTIITINEAVYGLIDERQQHQFEYDNLSVKLVKSEDGKYFVYFEAEANLNPVEITEDYSGEDALNDAIEDLISESHDSRLEDIRWNRTTIHTHTVDLDHKGECKVITIRHFYGYDPVDYASADCTEATNFDTYEKAKAWVREKFNGSYVLSHNEYARPDYFIVEA